VTFGDPKKEDIRVNDDSAQYEEWQYLREMKSIRKEGSGQRMGERVHERPVTGYNYKRLLNRIQQFPAETPELTGSGMSEKTG
jgi:hypothetical protein